MIPLTDQLACAKRELATRRSTYPGWVRAGKMTADAMQKQLDAMSSIVETLDKLIGLEEVSRTMRGDCKPKIKPEELFL